MAPAHDVVDIDLSVLDKTQQRLGKLPGAAPLASIFADERAVLQRQAHDPVPGVHQDGLVVGMEELHGGHERPGVLIVRKDFADRIVIILQPEILYRLRQVGRRTDGKVDRPVGTLGHEPVHAAPAAAGQQRQGQNEAHQITMCFHNCLIVNLFCFRSGANLPEQIYILLIYNTL